MRGVVGSRRLLTARPGPWGRTGRFAPQEVHTTDEHGAYVVARELFETGPPPTAIFAGYDMLAIRMGAAAIELLMGRIRDGRTAPVRRQIQPELRIRRSSRSPV